MITNDLASGTYCFIRLPRVSPEQQGMQEATCFHLEQVPTERNNPVMIAPADDYPTGQSAVDDHATNADEPPANCPLRNGVIPCTEACYRADRRWPGTDDPAGFLASERESGECYQP